MNSAQMIILPKMPPPWPTTVFVWLRGKLPVLALLVVIDAAWYAAAAYLNAPRVIAELNRTSPGWTVGAFADAAWSMKRPLLPAPHQIINELAGELFRASITSPRNLLYHAAVTLGTAVVGFGFAIFTGIGIAIAIVHAKFLEHRGFKLNRVGFPLG